MPPFDSALTQPRPGKRAAPSNDDGLGVGRVRDDGDIVEVGEQRRLRGPLRAKELDEQWAELGLQRHSGLRCLGGDGNDGSRRRVP